MRNIEAQRQALPLRRLYEAEVAEPVRALQLARMQRVREQYQERKKEIGESELSIEERLEAGRDALRTMRTAATAAYRELRSQPFGEWLGDREERRQRVASKALGQEQSVKRQRAMGRSLFLAEELVQSEGRDIER